jgi:hypothetical protein
LAHRAIKDLTVRRELTSPRFTIKDTIVAIGLVGLIAAWMIAFVTVWFS